jgi:hypothetical protein
MALAPRVAGKPISKLSLAKLPLNGLLISAPLMHNAPTHLSSIQGDFGALVGELFNEASVRFLANPYIAAGALLGFTTLEFLLVWNHRQGHGFQLKKVNNPKTSSRKLTALCQKSNYPDIRKKALERCKEMPKEVLQKIVEKDPDPKVRDAAIRHKNFPKSAVLEQISNSRGDKAAILDRLRSMPLSEEDWIKLLNNHDHEIRKTLLLRLQRKGENFSPDRVRKFFSCQYPEVKLAVLGMKGIEIPRDVLGTAMKSNNSEVRQAAFDRDIPEDLLIEQIRDPGVGTMVLEHPNTPSQDIARGLSELYAISKIADGVDNTSTIASILKKHSPEKALEIIACLEKINQEMAKKVIPLLPPMKADTR